jgi:hypothetical protein
MPKRMTITVTLKDDTSRAAAAELMEAIAVADPVKSVKIRTETIGFYWHRHGDHHDYNHSDGGGWATVVGPRDGVYTSNAIPFTTFKTLREAKLATEKKVKRPKKRRRR